MLSYQGLSCLRLATVSLPSMLIHHMACLPDSRLLLYGANTIFTSSYLSRRPRHAPFRDTASSPITFSFHGTSGKITYDYSALSLRGSDTNGASAKSALMNTAPPTSDRVTSHGTHSDMENKLRRPRQHYIRQQDFPANLSCNLYYHAKKLFVKFFSWRSSLNG